MVGRREIPLTNTRNQTPREMNVIALTIFISLVLALLFIALFIGDRFNARSGSLEQDSLLPLDGDDDTNQDKDADRKSND
ncbi:MAG: hypothetical protein ACI8XO_002283 [Verrucomicrobiales bacterium]|jgi:hypothetical protein